MTLLRQSTAEVLWLRGAAPIFDDDVTSWLRAKGVPTRFMDPEPRPAVSLPVLTRWRRVSRYRARLPPGPPVVLVLPYLGGDALLLSGSPRARTLGVALGSDVLRRDRSGRRERWFCYALRRYSGLWAVSEGLAQELVACGRTPDIVSAVGVDLSRLPSLLETPDPGLILSPRREGPPYRRDLIRQAAAGCPGLQLWEAQAWTRDRLLEALRRAEVVVSLATTDGAPATVMEALCLGAHVAASGGATVRRWLDTFGATYGEPTTAEEARSLLVAARDRAINEGPHVRRDRAERARRAFDRDRLLEPLRSWLALSIDRSGRQSTVDPTPGSTRRRPAPLGPG